MTTYSYTGRRREPGAVSGFFRTDDLPAWVEAKFKAGWRFLAVLEDGAHVGGITKVDDRRTWWAQSG